MLSSPPSAGDELQNTVEGGQQSLVDVLRTIMQDAKSGNEDDSIVGLEIKPLD